MFMKFAKQDRRRILPLKNGLRKLKKNLKKLNKKKSTEIAHPNCLKHGLSLDLELFPNALSTTA